MNSNYGSYRPATPIWSVGSLPSGPRLQQSPIHGIDQVQKHLKMLTNSVATDRMIAVQFLSSIRDSTRDLGTLIWEAQGAMAALLSDIMSIYPAMTSISTTPASFPSPLMQQHVIHVCNCIALFQSVASSPEVRIEFIRSNFTFYLFPFLHATNQSRECEMLKLASLGVLGTLVGTGSPEIISFLLKGDYVPLCLRVLKFGLEVNKIVAAFIIARIALDKDGLASICTTNGKLNAVLPVLNKVLLELTKQYSPKLAKNVIIAYKQILSVPEARSAAIEFAAKMRPKDIDQLKLGPNVDQEFINLFSMLYSPEKQMFTK